MKHKRVWSDEQRQAAAERARARFTKKPTAVVERTAEESTALAIEGQKIHEASIKSAGFIDRTPTTVTRDPEVQAVLDTMTPERKAKLEMIQAKNLAAFAQTKEGREALERMHARHNGTSEAPHAEVVENVTEPAHFIPEILREVPMKVPFRLTGSVSGLCVSELGPCQCGEAKLKWHPVCLKVRV